MLAKQHSEGLAELVDPDLAAASDVRDRRFFVAEPLMRAASKAELVPPIGTKHRRASSGFPRLARGVCGARTREIPNDPGPY